VSLEPEIEVLKDEHRTTKVNKLTVEGPPMFNMTTATKTHSEEKIRYSSAIV